MPILRNFHLEAELAASTWDMAASGDLLNLDMNSATLTKKRHITCLHFEDDTSKADLTASGASNLARAACGNDFRGRPK